ncbi:MAG: hypothetical protein DRQ14_05855 [Candidatus Latescibacterota bacterium]|nr:MAG: hypothetical protein DRQ14_05855 [Candidatus Latescibacterota bacterium]
MRDGVGLINMDHHVDTWEELRDALGVEETGGAGRTSSVRLGRSHYVVRLQEPEPEKGLLREVEFFKVKGGEPLLLSDDGSPLLSASSSSWSPRGYGFRRISDTASAWTTCSSGRYYGPSGSPSWPRGFRPS